MLRKQKVLVSCVLLGIMLLSLFFTSCGTDTGASENGLDEVVLLLIGCQTPTILVYMLLWRRGIMRKRLG